MRRRDDDEILFGAVLVEADREPRLPLGVGEASERCAAHTLFHEPRRELGPPLQEIVDAAGLGRRTRHVADEMDNDIAALDIGLQHGERIAAGRLKILLDLDPDIVPRQRVAQCVAIVAELIRHTGKKQFRHSPPPRAMAIAPMWHGPEGSAKSRRSLWRLMDFAWR